MCIRDRSSGTSVRSRRAAGGPARVSCWSGWPSACSPATSARIGSRSVKKSPPASTTAVGLGRRFGPDQLAGLRAAQAELIDRQVAALPRERRRDLLAVRPTIDLDPTDVEVYGEGEERIGWSYAGVRAGRPVPLVWAESGLVLTGTLLAGDQDVRPHPGVAPADALLALAVDLDVGRVQVDRRAHRQQVPAALARQRRDLAVDQLGLGGAQPGELIRAEPAAQPHRGRRRRRFGHRPQLRAGEIGAHRVQVGEEVPAGEHALGQPDQQLTRAGPPAARLDRTDVPLDGADDVEHPAGLGYQRQPTVRRQRRVVGAELDSRPAGRYGDHQTGAFPVRDSDGVATPIVLARKGICRLCERVSWIQRGLTRGSRSEQYGQPEGPMTAEQERELRPAGWRRRRRNPGGDEGGGSRSAHPGTVQPAYRPGRIASRLATQTQGR